MKEFEVTCINKSDRFNIHEHITHIGNTTGKWRLTREEAIKRIESKTEAFYVVSPTTLTRVYIGVVKEIGKHPYLRTYADWKRNDNLLSLMECWNDCKIIA